MSDLHDQVLDDEGDGRITMQVEGGRVFADYRREEDTLLVTHVEADPALRGKGAAPQFMKALAERARGRGERIRPLCSYAAVWFTRHPEYDDVLSRGF
jgi:hypothetical protein